MRNFEKKIGGRLRKFLGNLTLNLGKLCKTSVKFKINFEIHYESKNFRIIKSRLSRNHREQYNEKNVRKTW